MMIDNSLKYLKVAIEMYIERNGQKGIETLVSIIEKFTGSQVIVVDRNNLPECMKEQA